MDEYLILADGTKVLNAYVVFLEEGKIAIYADEITNVREAVELFADPKRTAAIHSYQYGEEHDWEGYVEVYAFSVVSYTTVCLKKEGVPA